MTDSNLEGKHRWSSCEHGHLELGSDLKPIDINLLSHSTLIYLY